MDVVTFVADDRRFLMEVSRVREVVASAALEPSGEVPGAIDGWMLLRGERVPVIDLRRRLGAPARRGGPVLVIDHPRAGPLGVRVDAVGEVRSSLDEPVMPVPSYFGQRTAWLGGLVLDGDRVAVLLDAAELLESGDAAELVGA